MKGYYTVKLLGGALPQAERIALETRYVQALETALGGGDRVRELCLAAAAAVPPHLGTELRYACDQAEAAAWQSRAREPDARFSVSAWRADDL